MLEFAFFKQLLPNTFDVVHRRHPLSCHCLLHRRRSIFAMLRDFRYRIIHWPVCVSAILPLRYRVHIGPIAWNAAFVKVSVHGRDK